MERVIKGNVDTEFNVNKVNHVRAFWVGGASLMLLIASMIFIIFIGLYPFKPIEVTGIEVLTNPIHAGESITYVIHMHKNTDLVPQISRWLVPMNDLEDHIPLIATTGSAHMGYNNKKITAGIPKWVKPGRYKIMNVVTYEYFGIRKVNFKYETPCFEVIAPEGKK